MITKKYEIDGMGCGHCVKAIETELSEIDLIDKQVKIGSARITYDETKTDNQKIIKAIKQAGYQVSADVEEDQ